MENSMIICHEVTTTGRMKYGIVTPALNLHHKAAWDAELTDGVLYGSGEPCHVSPYKLCR